MTDRPRGPRLEIEIANAIARVLLGITLIILGATNLFGNLFLRFRLPTVEATESSSPDFYAFATWLVLTLVFSMVPLLSGVWLVMRATKIKLDSEPVNQKHEGVK